MTPDAAFRRRLTLAAEIKTELLLLLPSQAERAQWLRDLARQFERAGPVERFEIDPQSPEAGFLP